MKGWTPFFAGVTAVYKAINFDEIAKSRHPVEKRGPALHELIEKTGFRFAPE
jgi:hypothetical protein